MLFAYAYVPHQMEKMQVFIDFIFFEVWCKAPGNGDFRFDLFDANAELKALMEAFYYDDTKGADFFYGHVERIYGLFAVLPPHQISQFLQWYQCNNDLERVCANDPMVHVARYKDIFVTHPVLGKELASFFRGLYDKSLLDLAVLKAKIGDIKNHSQKFFSENTKGKCPFCGVNDLKGIHHTRREAYDHYLPKYRYPFNSINFRNLAPACHECNSTYKLSKDPARNPAGRRKAFYPYAAVGHAIELQVTLPHADIENLTPADITLQFGPANISEEIDTWKDVYGIEERYKAKFCVENDGKYWLTQVLDEWLEDDRQPADFLATLARQAKSSPFAECNFLKKPFLDACQRAGLFNAIAEGA